MLLNHFRLWWLIIILFAFIGNLLHVQIVLLLIKNDADFRTIFD